MSPADMVLSVAQAYPQTFAGNVIGLLEGLLGEVIATRCLASVMTTPGVERSRRMGQRLSRFRRMPTPQQSGAALSWRELLEYAQEALTDSPLGRVEIPATDALAFAEALMVGDTFRVENIRLRQKLDALNDYVSDLEDEAAVHDAQKPAQERLAKVWSHLDRIRSIQAGAFTTPQVTVEEELAALLEMRREAQE